MWRHCSAVRSTNCPCRGPGFSSQCLHSRLQPVTPVPEINSLSASVGMDSQGGKHQYIWRSDVASRTPEFILLTVWSRHINPVCIPEAVFAAIVPKAPACLLLAELWWPFLRGCEKSHSCRGCWLPSHRGHVYSYLEHLSRAEPGDLEAKDMA